MPTPRRLVCVSPMCSLQEPLALVTDESAGGENSASSTHQRRQSRPPISRTWEQARRLKSVPKRIEGAVRRKRAVLDLLV